MFTVKTITDNNFGSTGIGEFVETTFLAVLPKLPLQVCVCVCVCKHRKNQHEWA